ncbi:MAG: pyruvate dehydrogenase E2 component (dihydrolipoamide acetyltransferase) [Gammaproteobacteria bacterium]|jgi:pyruvate dehydrogenase E2 component (dihydrolipoamide acetyltransferase)
MSDIIEVKVPDIGDFDAVEVIEVLVQAGDTVAVEQALITLESDKASMEIPSTHAGTIQDVFVKVGDNISEGANILTLSVSANTEVKKENTAEIKVEEAEIIKPEVITPDNKQQKQASMPQETAKEITPVTHSKGQIHASPSVRRFARELGLDITKITKPSGPKGRILKQDVKEFVKQALSSSGVQSGTGIPAIPSVDFTKFGEIEERPLGRIKKLTAINLTRSWLNVPMVTHHELADVTEMEAFRQSLKSEAEKKGVKVTFLAFIMKALVGALKEYPEFNASLSSDGNSLILKKYYHIGIAVDTPNGLVVPVFRDVDQKHIYDLAEEMAAISSKAREGKLSPKEMQGACMTISSLGGIGGTAFTPIVNAPEVAILGVTRSDMQPVWNGSEFEPRLMLPLDLTYDHRVIDGAAAAKFMVTLSGFLNDIRRVML